MFKASCLRLFDDIRKTGEQILVTKRGAPVAIVSPVMDEQAPIYGKWRDTIRITGEIVQSDWSAEFDADRT